MFIFEERFRFAFAFQVEKTNTLIYELTYEPRGTYSDDKYCVVNGKIRMNYQYRG